MLDTVWNLFCIAEEGVDAKFGGFEKTTDCVDWYEEKILKNFK